MTREIVQSSGDITSIAISPGGLVAYKIFYDATLRYYTSNSHFSIGYPYSGSLDRIRYPSYEGALSLNQIPHSNIVWDSINSRFLTLANEPILTTSYVLYSSDGINWTRVTPSAPHSMRSYAHIFTFNPNKIIVFPKDASSNLPLQSSDGINYSTLGTVQIVSGVISSIKNPMTNRCVVYGRNIYYSDDLGETWIKSTNSHSGIMTAMIWSSYKSSYIGVDSNSNFHTSPDAITWTQAATASTLGLSSYNGFNAIFTMFETSNGVLAVMGAGDNKFRFTKNFNLTDPFINSSALPIGFEGVFGHYFPTGGPNKVKIFGGINAIAVTPDAVE